MKGKKDKKKISKVKKWSIIMAAIILLSMALVLLIFKDKIFKTNIIGEYFKLTELTEYKENVKESKIKRIAIISQSTNFETEDKEDIEKILDFIATIEGSVDKSEISSVVSNTYGIVLYYKNDTNTVITISPNKFAVADSDYYNNKHAYYTTLQKLLKELK
ncbi:MAG: hypothetical protein IKL68_04950 [Clostridia bacterium]|nr:hypothetical protein [Clostridia bacterium]